MQPERQISVFCVMVGGALVYPEVRALLLHPETVPGAALMTGGGFGALGVCFGTLLASDGGAAWFKALLLSFWGLVCLGFAGAMQYGALRSPGALRMSLFELFTGLCLLAFFGVLYGVWRANKPKPPAGS